MNIMLVSVTERTREIGIRVAVGAQPGDIQLQFLTEAITLSLIGGIIGVLLGIEVSKLVGVFANFNAIVSTGSIVLAFSVSFVTGVFFGFYSASKAGGARSYRCPPLRMKPGAPKAIVAVAEKRLRKEAGHSTFTWTNLSCRFATEAKPQVTISSTSSSEIVRPSIIEFRRARRGLVCQRLSELKQTLRLGKQQIDIDFSVPCKGALMKTVAVLVESFNAYGRGLCQGIADYAAGKSTWSLMWFEIYQGLKDVSATTKYMRNNRVDGILLRGPIRTHVAVVVDFVHSSSP